MRQFIHVSFPRKMIRRRCQAAVGTLAQRRIRTMKLNLLICDFVGRANCRWSGIVIVKLPGDDLALLADAAFYVNHPGGAEVGPREFLFARPHEFYRLARSSGEA